MHQAKYPYLYRGYRYDTETGFYYLQSRCYNADWGRFINGDDTAVLQLAQGELLGANLFAYCINNPINMIDEDGFLYQTIFTKFPSLINGVENVAVKYGAKGASAVKNVFGKIFSKVVGKAGLTGLIKSGKTPVIGKMKDLSVVGKSEVKVADYFNK